MEKRKHLEQIKRLNALIDEFKISKGLKRDDIFNEIFSIVKYVYIAIKQKYFGFNNIDIKSLALEALLVSLNYYDTKREDKLRFPMFFGRFLKNLIVTNYYLNRLVSLPHDLAIRKPSRNTKQNLISFEKMKTFSSISKTYNNSDKEMYPLLDHRYRPDADTSAADKVKIILKDLTLKERYVVESFYGVNRPKKTLVKIGKEYGVSRERIRQIIALTKNKIWAKYKNVDEI